MATKNPKFIGRDSVYLPLLLRAATDPQAVDSLNELLKRQPIDALALIDLVKDLRESGRRSHQQNAANKKHASNQAAKTFVHRLWHAQRNKYLSNIEFSRAAVVQVLKKFDVNVKAETIARDWLRGIGPSMSTTFKSNARAYVDGKYIGPKLLHKSR